MKRLLYIFFLIILSNKGFSQEEYDKKISYDWNSIDTIKLIEVDRTIDLKDYKTINNLFNDRKEIAKRELVELKSVLKFNNCCDVAIEDRKILMNIKFKNESVIFLVHLNQAALFDLRPNKFNFLTIINKRKFQDLVTELLNK